MDCVREVHIRIKISRKTVTYDLFWAHRGGRQKYWIKVKNRKHPAMYRVMYSLK